MADDLLTDADMGLQSDADMGLSDAPQQDQPQQDQPQPQKEQLMSDADMGLQSDADMGITEDKPSLPGAVGREVARQAAPFAGGIAGMAAGAGAGAMIAPALGPAAPVAPFVGAVVGGMGGGALASSVQDWVLDKLGLKDRVNQSAQEDQAAQPWAKDIADVGLTAASFAFNPGATVAQRLLGAGAMGGLEAGTQAYQGHFDPSEIALRAAEGAVFTDPRRATAAFMRPFEKAGAQAAQKLATRAGTTAPTSGARGTSETPPPPNESADVGNDTSPPERSERTYAKDNATPAGQASGVVETPDFMTPEFMAAMENQNPRNLTEGPVKGAELPGTLKPEEQQAPVPTGFEGLNGKPPEVTPESARQMSDAELEAAIPQGDGGTKANPIRDMVNRMSDEDVVDASRQQRAAAQPKGNGELPADAFDYSTAPQTPRYPNPAVEGQFINRNVPVKGVARLKGNELFVDRNVPPSIDVGGKPLDPAIPLAIRETAFQHALKVQEQVPGGRAMARSQKQALAREAADVHVADWLQKNGYDPHAYAEALKGVNGHATVEPVREQTAAAPERMGEPVPERDQPADLSGLRHVDERGDITIFPDEEHASPRVNEEGVPDFSALKGLKTDADMGMGEGVTATVTEKPEGGRLFKEAPATVPEAPAPAPKKRVRAVAENGVQARTKGDAERINRSLLAAERGMEKAKPISEDFDPRDRKQVAEVKADIKAALEHARTYNRGMLPHESYKPYKGRGENVKQPPAEWSWSQAADAFVKGRISAQEFAVQDRLYRSGNAEDVALARQGNKIESDIKLNRQKGDAAVASAEAEGNTLADVMNAGGTRTPIKTREDLNAFEGLKKADEDQLLADTSTIKENLAKVYDEPPEMTVTDKMREQRAAREAFALLNRGEAKPAPKPSEGAASEVRKVPLTDDVKKAALAALAKSKNRGESIETSAVHGPEVLPKTPYKDLFDRFGRDESGALNFGKINGAFKAKLGELKEAANKYFGVTVNNVQRHFDPILAGAMSLQAKLSAEKSHLLDGRWYQWNKVAKEDVWRYLDVLEGQPDGATHSDFSAALRAAGIDAARANWMADEALFHRQLMDQIYNTDQHFVKNYERLEGYVAHQFEDAKGVQEFLDQKRQSLGATWFTKERVFDTIREAEAAGFKLKHQNPIDIISSRWASSINDWMIVSTLRKLNKEGLAFPVAEDPNSPTPVWARKTFKQIPATPDGVAWMIAPEGVNLWKNAMESKSLFDRDDALGGAFRTWMKIKNVWMPLQLGLSLFHEAHVVANINPVANLVRAARVAAGTKDFGELGRALKYSMTDPFLALPLENVFKGRLGTMWKGFEGTRLIENYKQDPNNLSPVDRTWQSLIQETGARLEQNEDTINAGRALAKAWQEANYPGIAGNAIRRGVQATQDWMMKYQIPRLKAVALKRDIEAAFRLDPSLATDAAKRRIVLRQIGQNVDDRFGEMFYKSMFWNRYLKDAGIASFLSLSWNVGQVRQASGALHDVYDRAKMATGLGQQPSGARQIQVLSNDRIAFVSGYIAMSMAAAGGMSWALSGQLPSGLDWFMPRNGEKNPDGTPARLTVPFNTREAPMLIGHTQEAGNVMAGLAHMVYNKMIISPIVEAAQNRDFFGRELYDPHAPWYKRAVQLVDSTLLNHASPISVTGAQRTQELGGGKRDFALALAGFGPAPAYISHDAMQNAISHDYYAGRGERPYEYGKSGMGRGLVQNQLRKVAGDKLPSEGRQEGYTELNRAYATGDEELKRTARERLVREGGLSAKTAGTTRPDQQFQRMFRQIPLDAQVARFKEMTKEQRDLYVYKNPLMGRSQKAKLLRAAGVNPGELP